MHHPVWVLAVAAATATAACNHHAPTTTDADAQTADALTADALTTDAAAPTNPFTTPPNTWTWVDVPGMFCGNHTPTGIGVNLSTTSSDVLVYFEGGGACWDVATCFQTKTAVHVEDGFNASTFAAEGSMFPFKRDVPGPLATPTYIFVPYCTGDIHSGINVATYSALGQTKTVDHVGASNAQLVADRVRAALPSAAHVWVTGSSAGGFGASLNLHRFRAAYPTAVLALLQDSSPFVHIAGNYGAWQAQWKMQFPPGCTTPTNLDCEHDITQIVAALTSAEPNTRIGLLTYDNDTTIKLFFGYGLFDSLVPATTSLLATRYDLPTTHVFLLSDVKHTMLGQLAQISGLAAWVDQWASGDPAWMSTP